MIELFIPLPPIPWSAPLKSKNRFYDRKEKEKRCARYYIGQQYPDVPLSDYVVLEFTFHFLPPKSASKGRKAAMLAWQIFPTRSDCTNLQKLYEDCLKGIVIEDDRKVAKIISEKLYDDKEGTSIKVYTVDEYYNVCDSRRNRQMHLCGSDHFS